MSDNGNNQDKVRDIVKNAYGAIRDAGFADVKIADDHAY